MSHFYRRIKFLSTFILNNHKNFIKKQKKKFPLKKKK